MANSHNYRYHRSWNKFLNPDKLKANLARAGIFLVAYEILRTSIVDKPRTFLSTGYEAQKNITSKEYKKEVVKLYPKDIFHASCLWFRNQNAITEEDVEFIQRIRAHRNNIAHELIKYLTEVDFSVDMQLLDSIGFLLSKVDRWWIRKVEMLVNPDFDDMIGQEIEDKDITSGNMVLMGLITKIITGRESELTDLLNKLVKETDNPPKFNS